MKGEATSARKITRNDSTIIPRRMAKKSLYEKAKIRLKNAELNRYRTLDYIAHGMLGVFGQKKINMIFYSAMAGYIPVLKLIAGWMLLRMRSANQDVSEELYSYFKDSNLKYVNYCLADWLLKHRDYSARTEYHFERAQERNREININFRYTDFVTQKYGYKSDKLKRIIKRLMSIEVKRNLTKSQKLRLAIILYHCSQAKAANEIVKGIGKNFLLNNTTSPYVFKRVYKYNIFSSPYFERGAKIYDEILRGRQEFQRRLVSSRESFCLVGNAPTEIGTGNGSNIDAKDLVIRINDYSLNHVDDYGCKQDVWIRVANKEITQDHLSGSSLVVFAANNFAVKRKDAARYLLPPHLMGKEYTVIPSHIYRELIARLDGLPSTGLVIAYWIYTIIGKISRDSLFGFSHLVESSDFKAHYYADQIEIGTHLHEWEKERLIFNQITK